LLSLKHEKSTTRKFRTQLKQKCKTYQNNESTNLNKSKKTAKDSSKNQSKSYFCLTKKKTNKKQVPESESKKSKQKKRKNKQQKHIKYMNFQTNPPPKKT
jgi:hypothetical protein